MLRHLLMLVVGVSIGQCSPSANQPSPRFGWRATPPSVANQKSPLPLMAPPSLARLSSVEPQNSTEDAVSLVYFHQDFRAEPTNHTSSSSGTTTTATPATSSEIGDLATVGNLTSSETQHYYGYDPGSYSHSIDHGSNRGKRHYYPPVPGDVASREDNDDDDQNKDSQNDDEENDDDYDDDGEGDDEGQQNDPGNQSSNNGGTPDGTVTEKYNDEDAQKIIDEIDGDIYKQDKDFGTIDADDDLEFDQDNSATHPVPKVDKATKACKTVYEELSADEPKSFDDFKKRRKRSVPIPSKDHSSSSSSFSLVSSECTFTDQDSKKEKIPPKAVTTSKSFSKVTISKPFGKNKTRITEESRIVPINVDMMSSGSMLNRFQHSPTEVRRNQKQHYHKYPYPHYHIYYNRDTPATDDVSASVEVDEADPEIEDIIPRPRAEKPAPIQTDLNQPKEYSYKYFHDHKAQKRSPAVEPTSRLRVKRKRKSVSSPPPIPMSPLPLNDDYDGDDGGNDDDYSVSFGSGNFKQFDKTFDSDKDRDGGGGGGGGGGGHSDGANDDYDGGDGEGGQDDDDGGDYSGGE